MAQYQRKLAKGIRWYYKFDINGKTHFSKTIYLTKQEAKKAEADFYLMVSDIQVTNTGISVNRAVYERLEGLKVKLSDKYYKDNKRYLNYFVDYFKSKNISDVTKKDINNFILSLSAKYIQKGKSNFSINAAIRCYKAFYNFIIDQYDLNMKNPFVKFKFFSIDKKLKYIPTDDEIDALLKVCNEEQTLLIKFILQTGARINEALHFTYGDISKDYIVLYTRKSVNSNRTPRKVPLPDCLKDLNIKGNQRLFDTWTDRPKFLDRKLKSLDLTSWGFHNLRHRFASKLSKEGIPIFEIMNLLGHQSIETTQLYLQLLT